MSGDGYGESNYLSEESILAETSQKLAELDSLDVGNILEEDVEKSRNWFLTSSIITVSTMMFGLDDFNFFGTRVQIIEEIALIAFANLVAATFFLGIYFLINANSNYLAKFSKRAKAENILVSISSLMERNRNSIEAPHGAPAENLVETHNKNQKLFRDFEKSFDRQIRALGYLPWAIFIVCNSFTVVAFSYTLYKSFIQP